MERAVVEAWMRELVSAVLDESPAVRDELSQRGLSVIVGDMRLPPRVAGPGDVLIGGGVTEVGAESLTVSARFRFADDGAASASCTVRLEADGGRTFPISKAVRDGLIASAHAARHFV